MPTIRCFAPIDADDFRNQRRRASDFSNLRQNGLVRITLSLPPTIRLIDSVTNAVSNETSVDVWRMVPTVNNVALTGPDASTPVWPRDPNPTGGYQLDARITTLQEQAAGALVNHAQIPQAPQRLLDDLSSFQRTLFTNHRVRALADAVRDGRDGSSRSGSAAQRARATGQGGVRASVQPVPWRSRAVDPGVPGESIQHHLEPVSASGGHRDAGSLRVRGCPPRLARNARTYEIVLSLPTQGPTGIIPAGTKVRRTSSDPGRALQTGFVGGPGPFDDWDKFDVPGLRGLRATAPYFHNNSAATLEDVVDHYVQFFKRIEALTAPGAAASPAASTDGVHFDRIPQPEERAALLAYLRRL